VTSGPARELDPGAARYRVVREAPATGASEQVWQSDDPMVVFALVLEGERARRLGAPAPRLSIECRGGGDPALLEAIRRNAPWVEIREALGAESASRTRATGCPAPQSPSSRTAPQPAGPSSPALALTAEELSMLFGAAHEGAESA